MPRLASGSDPDPAAAPRPGPRRLPARPVSAVRGLVQRFRGLLSELGKFGLVGFLSLGVDLVVFNVVLAVLPHKPLTAKVVSTVASATNAYVLNRHWSFKARTRQHALGRELALFAVLNALGLLIALACLAVSHYGLGHHSRLADNIAANGFGLVLGTAFRFWSYRRFVWVHPGADVLPLRPPAQAYDRTG
jgi:putative flippase GtrA